MEITVKERAVSIRSEYEIETSGSYYFARKAFFSFPSKIELQASDGRALAAIRGRLSFLREKYDFLLSGGGDFHFQCVNRWKRVFVCEGDKESFRVYGHKGLKFSIFKGETQVAAFEKNRIVFGCGNQYDVRLNDNVNVILIVCIVLALCNSEDDDHGAGVTIDMGSIGPEEKAYDEHWQPS